MTPIDGTGTGHDRFVVRHDAVITTDDFGPTDAGFHVASDGTAFVWPPLSGSAHEQATVVMQTLVKRLDELDCRIALVTVDLDRHDQQRVLKHVGFTQAGQIGMLRCELQGHRLRRNDRQLTKTSFNVSNASRFATLIDRCRSTAVAASAWPQLSGEETLASYAASSDFTPGHWWIATRDGRDVGVALVNAGSKSDGDRVREVAYLGVAPDVRRRGVGSAMLQAVLSDAAEDGVSTVVATVELDNVAATSLYRHAGFSATGSRLGFVRRRAV